MSVRLMSAIWDMEFSPVEKLILLAVADWANDEGLAWPSIAQLAKKTGCGERTVQRTLRAVEQSGLLKRHENPGKGCSYRINPRHAGTPATEAPVPQTTRTPATLAPNTPVHTNPQKASPSSVARAGKSLGFHRMPVGWMPTMPFPEALQAKIDDWPPGKLDDELDALRGWAANAENKQGKGLKRDWDQAAHNWLRKADSDWRIRNGPRNGSRVVSMAGPRGASVLDAAELAMQDFGYHRH